jgi:hypothetical protein
LTLLICCPFRNVSPKGPTHGQQAQHRRTRLSPSSPAAWPQHLEPTLNSGPRPFDAAPTRTKMVGYPMMGRDASTTSGSPSLQLTPLPPLIWFHRHGPPPCRPLVGPVRCLGQAGALQIESYRPRLGILSLTGYKYYPSSPFSVFRKAQTNSIIQSQLSKRHYCHHTFRPPPPSLSLHLFTYSNFYAMTKMFQTKCPNCQGVLPFLPAFRYRRAPN